MDADATQSNIPKKEVNALTETIYRVFESFKPHTPLLGFVHYIVLPSSRRNLFVNSRMTSSYHDAACALAFKLHLICRRLIDRG